MTLKDRIRGYLPVVIDVETAGFNENTDALLEICAIILGFDDNGNFFSKKTDTIMGNSNRMRNLPQNLYSLMKAIQIYSSEK